MTSDQKSSGRRLPATPYANIESLAGVFHPHAIEVQDFAHYALVLDVRSQAEYEDDHIPGAVRHEPLSLDDLDGLVASSLASSGTASVLGAERTGRLPAALAAVVEPFKLNQPMLLYCGSGGRVSRALAEALRRQGRTVDVMPGGWINYRRWVQAGLEMLPRLVTFRVIACSLGCEASRVLQALRDVGQQVLDIGKLAAWRHGSLNASSRHQPRQAWFESQLLQELRGFDPRSPVWTAHMGAHTGSVSMPGALIDALAMAPMAVLKVEVAERVRHWQEDELLADAEAAQVMQAVEALSPTPGSKLLERWRQLAAKGATEAILSSVLADHADPTYDDDVVRRLADRQPLPPLPVDSFAPRTLAMAVRQWLPAAAPRFAAG